MEKVRYVQTENIFQDYPDVVNIKQLCKMLGGIGIKSAYKLINENRIGHIKIGRTFYIPKFQIINYLESESRNNNL